MLRKYLKQHFQNRTDFSSGFVPHSFTRSLIIKWLYYSLSLFGLKLQDKPLFLFRTATSKPCVGPLNPSFPSHPDYMCVWQTVIILIKSLSSLSTIAVDSIPCFHSCFSWPGLQTAASIICLKQNKSDYVNILLQHSWNLHNLVWLRRKSKLFIMFDKTPSNLVSAYFWAHF